MKALLAIAVLFAGTAHAMTNVCVNMPDGVKAESIVANFDGSITYSDISVFAQGEYRRVWGSHDAGTGLCTIWGAANGKMLFFTESDPDTDQVVAVVRADGTYGGSYKESQYRNVKILSTVTCR